MEGLEPRSSLPPTLIEALTTRRLTENDRINTPEPDSKRQQQINDYTTEAVQVLQETLRLAGPMLATQVKSQIAADRALDALRDKPSFQQLTGKQASQ